MRITTILLLLNTVLGFAYSSAGARTLVLTLLRKLPCHPETKHHKGISNQAALYAKLNVQVNEYLEL